MLNGTVFRSQRAHSLVGTSQRNCAMKGFPRTTTTKTHKRKYLPTYLPYYARDEVRTNANYNNQQQQQYSYSQQQQQQKEQQQDEKIL